MVSMETMSRRELLLGLVRVPIATFLTVAIALIVLGNDGFHLMDFTRQQALMLGLAASIVPLIRVALYVRKNWDHAS